ncbi:FCRLA protein, partial [Origma solitaria]|nr:FCRLA protein [Origma solitaria]
HPCLTDQLVLQVPAWALLEGYMVTLCCRVRKDTPVTRVRFYHKEMALGGPLRRTEQSLSSLQLHHSGRYLCGSLVGLGMSRWHMSAPVTVTVHGEHPHSLH